jgi:hypothetical protein
MAASALPNTFSGMDVLFYGIAVYEGYRLSLRRLPEAEINALRYYGSTGEVF